MFYLFQNELAKSFMLYAIYGIFIYIYAAQTAPLNTRMNKSEKLMHISLILIAYKFYIFTMEVIFKWN